MSDLGLRPHFLKNSLKYYQESFACDFWAA